MAYVYKPEQLERLLSQRDGVLHFERYFGPPADYPHPVLETVRRQLPTSRAVYRFECWCRPLSADLARGGTVLLRIPQRNELFAGMTRVPDERLPLQRVIYFGVDLAASQTGRQSANLVLPYGKVDVLVAGRWMPLSHSVIVALADIDGCEADLAAV